MKKDKKKKADENVLKSGESPENDFSGGEIESELRQPVWSVVSFEQCAAKNLTYDDAAKKIAELEKQGISGLCLVTDTVAERIAKG
ncbi:MAG TPA: hypothetical protein VF692_08380 [Pyrinomonadaceae bacterium]|jgi:hypothetical protein